MKTYTYYIEFKTRCAETITIEALDVFKSHFKDYEVTEIRKFRDIIKPLTKTITVEL